ncbi:MAG: alanyl-tRNA editing protein [Casimicrobium sp.]
MFRDDAYMRVCDARVLDVRVHTLPDGSNASTLVLDRTICYPEGGGQPGDRATLLFANRSTSVVDSRKSKVEGEGDVVLHVLEADAMAPNVGDAVTVDLDWERRYLHMRYHTMLHLVCAALPGVYATGNAIDTTKARIDFDLSNETTPFDRDATEARINELIRGNHAVETVWFTDEELDARPELVRTMSVAPPCGVGRLRVLKIGENIDLQPCGGTHVKNTSEIGVVKILKVENKGKQNRRIVFQFA